MLYTWEKIRGRFHGKLRASNGRRKRLDGGWVRPFCGMRYDCCADDV